MAYKTLLSHNIESTLCTVREAYQVRLTMTVLLHWQNVRTEEISQSVHGKAEEGDDSLRSTRTTDTQTANKQKSKKAKNIKR